MRRKVPFTVAVIAGLGLALAGCGDTEDETPAMDESPAATPGAGMPGAPGAGEDRAALMAEYQQIQQRLGSLQQQAMQDSSLQETFADLQSDIQDEMDDADPEYAQKQEKLENLQQEMTAARQAGDQEAMETITQEGMALQGELEQLRASTMEDEEIASAVEAFRDSLEARMTEIDPETPELLARASEIAMELQGQPPVTPQQ